MPTIDIAEPPSDRPFVARGIVQVDTSLDDDETLPFSFDPALEPDFPPQKRIVAKYADGKELWELCAAVPAGTTQVTCERDFVAPSGPLGLTPGGFFDRKLLRELSRPGALALSFSNGNTLVTENLSLSGWAPAAKMRDGRWRKTTVYHANTQHFGGVHWFFDLSAYDSRLFLTINWHNGIPRSDVLFSSVLLHLPSGWRWKPVLEGDRIYDAANGYLVRPDDPTSGLPVDYVLPQRCERPFRLVLWHEDNPEPTVTADDGLGYQKTGRRIGPSHMTMPDLSYLTGLDASVDSAYDAMSSALFNLTNETIVSTQTPHSYLYPTMGSAYGGQTGGIYIDWFQGVRLCGSGRLKGLKELYIRQLRTRARPSGCIYADVVNGQLVNLGLPVSPERSLVNGAAPWKMQGNRRFLKTNNGPTGVDVDAPWNFKAYPRPAGPVTNNMDIHLDYLNGGWDPHDTQHGARMMRDNIALAFVAGDELAWLYLAVDAETGRMAEWNKPGQNRPLSPVPVSGYDRGLNWGRSTGWVSWLVAASAALNWATPARFANLKAYGTFFAVNRNLAQMPSGLVQALTTGKAAIDPPFGDGSVASYAVAQDFEEFIMAMAHHACFAVFGEFAYGVPFPGQTTEGHLQGLLTGLRGMMWHTDVDGQTVQGVGPWERTAVGPNSVNARYTDRTDFNPLDICVPPGGVGNYEDGYYVAAMLWLGLEVGHDVLLDINRHLGVSGQDEAACKALVQAKGLPSPSAGTGPIETFVGLLHVEVS